MSEKELPAEALALKYLREAAGVTRKEHAARLGHANDGLLGKLERGDKEMSRDLLVSYAEPVDQTPEAVDALLALHSVVRHVPVEEEPSPVSLSVQELGWIDRTCLALARCVLVDVRAELIRWKKGRKARVARREAERLWPGLQKATPQRRRELVEVFPGYRTWAMAERVCAASVRKAADNATDALELARFALFIADRLPEGFRSRVQGFCWGHIGNAERVGNDWHAADQSFVRAWALWKAGEDSGLLPEWRLYSLEASLRREQQRFPEALERLDTAWVYGKADQEAAAHILLKRANVLEQMEDSEGALQVLDEAAPLIQGDSYLLFALKFNRADNLLRMNRFEEAAHLVPEVRTMALEQGDILSLMRVVWLEAKTLAGQGRKLEAMDRLEQVWSDFTDRQLPYDAALSALDLALLKLEAGRLAEVREMALSLSWVFGSKRIHREALVALGLFCEAARQEAATVELTRRTIAEIEKVWRNERD